MSLARLLPFLTVFVILAQAQISDSVNQMIEMVKAGLSEELIVAKLRQDNRPHNLSVPELLHLKKAGVSENIIKVMLSPSASPSPAAVSGQSTAPVAASAYPTEIGVYAKKSGQWAEVLPEVVNWKTGGVLKGFATAGIVKGDVNGNIQGPNSRNSLKTPIEFLIVSAEGVAITEYQLLRLRIQKDYREFRTVTGGVLHAKGGATRDLVPFEGKKVAPRTYEVVLPSTMSSGEYGILPPGAFGSASSASMGKIYSFRFLE